MPEITTNNPSWLSAVRANDKPVYLNKDGEVSSGRSFKGLLVDVAESFGIFKDYAASYRADKAIENRDAYEAAWGHVRNQYGIGVKHDTESRVEEQGYSPAARYLSRLTSRDATDPTRAVVGRELRAILDTARGIDQQYGGSGADAVRVDDAPPSFRMQTAMTSYKNVRIPPKPQPREQYQGRVPGMDVNDVPESLWDPYMWVPDLKRPGEAVTPQAPEVKKELVEVPKELGRAMVASNKELVRELVHDKVQLKALATELGYDPNAVSARRTYIESKLDKLLETDPRAKSDTLSKDEMHEMVRTVFDKALAKSKAAAGIRGAMRSAASKVKHALDEDSQTKVDVLALTIDKVKAGARDKGKLQQLVTERLGAQNQKVDSARMSYIEQLARKEASDLVAEKRIELSSAEVDDILTHALLKSFEVSKSKARAKGFMGKMGRAVKLQEERYLRDVDAVRTNVAEQEAEEARLKEEQATGMPSPAPEPEATTQTPDQVSGQMTGQTPPPSPTSMDEPPTLETAAPTPPQTPTAPSTPTGATAALRPTRQEPPAIATPRPYKGVDFFSRQDRSVRGLSTPIKNHQRAKQVVTDDNFIASTLPEGKTMRELTPTHREYIKTTVLRHVAEHEHAAPNSPLTPERLHRMVVPVTARALEMEDGSKLKAKVLYKNVVKRLGRKEATFNREIKKLQQDARSRAAFKLRQTTFVKTAADHADIRFNINDDVIKAIRSDVKDLAEAHVEVSRTAVTDSDLENFVQIALRRFMRGQ